MSDTAVTPLDAYTDAAVALAREWFAAPAAAARRDQRATDMLAKLVADREGLDFTVRFVDRVARPEDPRVAASELTRLARGSLPSFVSPVDRVLLRAGALAAPLAPGLTVSLAKRRMRQMVGHLVGNAEPAALTRHLAQARRAGFAINLNLLGEAVLGEAEASSRLARVIDMVRRDDVDYVSVKVSALASNLVTWDLAGSAWRVGNRLHPLFEAARETDTFVNLDMEEYRDVDLTLEVFDEVALAPEFLAVRCGIVVQAYLPDAWRALDRVIDIARRRAAAGGVPVKVRLVKGANLAMEEVDARLHGWVSAPYDTKADTDACYVAAIDRLLRPDVPEHLRVGVAGHNLFHLALAYVAARDRGVAHRVDYEMLQGMAPAQAAAVRDTTGSTLLYTPIVAPRDFDVAVAYLVRRMEENAAPQNFIHQMMGTSPDPLAAAERAFRDSVRDRATVSHRPRRVPDAVARDPRDATTASGAGRELPTGSEAVLGRESTTGFANQPDSDPAIAATRRWAMAWLARDPGPVRHPQIDDAATLDAAVDGAREVGRAWAGVDVAERADVLLEIAAELQARRGELLSVMAHEAGKTLGEADPEISEAIDFARYYAFAARSSLRRPGLVFEPFGLTAIIPPWNFPVAIPLGGVFAALAAGSAVVIKPARLARRCTEVGVGAIHAVFARRGIDPRLVTVIHVAGGDLGRRLVEHEAVDAVVLTGSIETARRFAAWRPELRLLAETSGKNAIVVTPSADIDLAVADIVRSAFGHAGQKCSAGSLAIVVGSQAASRRFFAQLRDATRSLSVGPATDPGTQMGPLIAPAEGKLLRALTQLEPGERWLVRPRRLDATGELWSPGVRTRVAPGSFFHLTECFGPVLGVMRARDLDEAIALQNGTPFGLTAGLHSLDPDEIAVWMDRVEAGNLYIGRSTTGAIVRRQPFGGWKASAIGGGAKAGGPNYVAEFGRWRESGAVDHDRAWLAAAQASDRQVWADDIARPVDPSALGVEHNVFRYRAAPSLTIRAGVAASPIEVARVASAARLAGVARVELSHQPDWHPGDAVGIGVSDGVGDGVIGVAEPDVAFAARVAGGRVSGRVRLVGSCRGLAAASVERLGEVSVIGGPVLGPGGRELHALVREQAVSMTAHRFGHPVGDLPEIPGPRS